MPKQPMGRFSHTFTSVPLRIQEQAVVNHFDKSVEDAEQVFSYISPYAETLHALTVVANQLTGATVKLDAVVTRPDGTFLKSWLIPLDSREVIHAELNCEVPAFAIFTLTAHVIPTGETFTPSVGGMAISLGLIRIKKNSAELQEKLAEQRESRQ